MFVIGKKRERELADASSHSNKCTKVDPSTLPHLVEGAFIYIIICMLVLTDTLIGGSTVI